MPNKYFLCDNCGIDTEIDKEVMLRHEKGGNIKMLNECIDCYLKNRGKYESLQEK